MAMIPIAAGAFTMGSTDGDWDEQPVHRVVINRALFMSQFSGEASGHKDRGGPVDSHGSVGRFHGGSGGPVLETSST